MTVSSELDRLAQQYVDEMNCGRQAEAARTLAKRDELLLTELVTKSQIARLFGVSASAVSNWTMRYADFPKPRIGDGRTARYMRNEVVAWWTSRHADLLATLKLLEDK